MPARWIRPAVDEASLQHLAELVAALARPGDLITLAGALGSGKSTFARAFIRAVLDDPEAEVPSPTFTIAQTYEAERFPVLHLDLYRLSSAEELVEIGVEEALARGVVVVEWPERLDERLDDRIGGEVLRLALEDAGDGARRLILSGHGRWAERLSRAEAITGFLGTAGRHGGWDRARMRYMQGDASPRGYMRLEQDRRRVVLMNAPAMPDGPVIRDGKPYSRIAHLAESIRPFAAVGEALRARGIAAPRILARDLERGLLLIEDMGDLPYARALAAGADQRELWRAATDVLIALRRSGPPEPMRLGPGPADVHVLPNYDAGALAIESELMIEWYWPAVMGAPASVDVRTAFAAAWRPLFAGLAAEASGWVLRDHHSPNLMWRPGETGIARAGVLDFQDAVTGPWAYDLVSLLQDARLDVPAALEAELKAYYVGRVSAFEPDFDAVAFDLAYAALGAQRNTKIIGIFTRLARRDGKPAYLALIPRIWAYLERDLAHPELASVRDWLDRHIPPAVRTRRIGA